MPKIKLIACDMDGTLLDNDKHISKENIAAVRKLKEAGTYFVIATGRHDSMIKAYMDELNIEMPVISCNGALVRNPFTDRMFSSSPIEKEKVLSIAEICREHGVDYHIYCHHKIYGEKMSGKIIYYNQRNQDLPERDQIKLHIDADYKNFINDTPEELYKVLILSRDADELNAVREAVTAETGLLPAQSDKDLIDTMQLGITKAKALNDLITELGISIEETAAIGDYLNDLDMIKFAGTGVAMANAVPEVKAAAAFVTEKSNHHGGVAEAIERLIG